MKLEALLTSILALALCCSCNVAATGDTDVEWGGGSGGDGGTGDGGSSDGGSSDGGGGGCPVTVSYVGSAVTISGNPVGLSDADRDSEATGSLTYDACVFDGNDDPDSGDYDHSGRGAFDLLVASASVTGSGSPIIEILDGETQDTFRYIDGPQFGDKVDRVMSLNGEQQEDLDLWISISDGDGQSLSDDSLPADFPMVDISCCTHTFSISDESGTLLLQLDSMEQQ